MRLQSHNGSDRGGSLEQFLLSSYFELRRLARALVRREAVDQTNPPTALVHEAAVRLLKRAPKRFNDRQHFFRSMVREMRCVIVDAARKRQRRTHYLEEQSQRTQSETAAFDPVEVLALNEALQSLERLDRSKAQVAELRLLGGLSYGEIASITSVSERTVERQWASARSHLALSLQANGY